MISGIRAVGFDLDGTFLKTHVDYKKLNCVDAIIMKKYGIMPSLIGCKDQMRIPRYMIRNWLKINGRINEFDTINREIDDTCTLVEKEYIDEATPFPRSIECIDVLKSKGLKVGILTRGGHDYAYSVLSRFGIFDHIDAVVGRDYSGYDNAKPSPIAMVEFAGELGVMPYEMLYVGDNITDYLSAKYAGAKFIGVLSGSCTFEDWKKQDPNIVTMHYAGDIMDLV